MKLRRLSKDGLKRFESYLGLLKQNPSLEVPTHYLTDGVVSEPVSDCDVQPMQFGNRFEAGVYLAKLMDEAGIKAPEREIGMWAWLSLYYFDQVCPANASGKRKPGDVSRHIPSLSFRKFYRHLLLGPYFAVRQFRDDPTVAMAILVNPVDKPGEVAEQLSGSREFFSNRGVMALATKLYYDPATGKNKRGAGGSSTFLMV